MKRKADNIKNLQSRFESFGKEDLVTNIERFLHRRRNILTLAALTLFLTWPALISSGVYPSGIDTPAHLFKLEVLQEMLQSHGEIFSWSDAWYAGYPFLTLYAPMTYYISLAFGAVFGDTQVAFNVFRIFLLFTTGLLAYLILQKEVRDSRVALMGGVFALTAIPIHNNIFAVGRIPYAMGLIVYLSAVYLLLQDEIYKPELNKHHLYLALTLAFLVVTHPMAAYFLTFLGIVLLFVYSDKISSLGFRPVIFVGVIAALFSLPYVVTFMRHSFITDPYWIRASVPTDLMLHITRNFDNTRPRYLGLVHVSFILVGLMMTLFERKRFQKVAALNFGFFYLLYWSHDLGILHYIPFHSQFDIPRFEVMFILWGCFIAAYGVREILSFKELQDHHKKLLIVGLIGLILVDVGPVTQSTQNWSPEFDVEQDYGINNSHRAVMVGARHWGSYILPSDFEVSNTFGWFPQADPSYNFTQALQNTGGLWYPSDPAFSRKINSTLRKNLMRLSNTKYIMFAKKNWVDEKHRSYTIGGYQPGHELNDELFQHISTDPDFNQIEKSQYLEIFALDRNMSYCETVEPAWISKNYFSRARSMLATEEAFPSIPVNHRKPENYSKTREGSTVSCDRLSPENIRIETSRPSWVLVKSSYYPFWSREDGSPIYNSFGFMATYVNGTAEVVYEDLKSTEDSVTLRS